MALKWFDSEKRRPRIIGFCGYARVGKNTAANILSRLIYDTFDISNIIQIGFADPIKRNLAQLIEFCEAQGYDTKSPDFKEKFRPMYVEWSKVYKAITNNEKVWCDIALRKIHEAKEPLSMITDVRYAYEIDRILNNNGIVFYIDRPGFEPANDEEDKSFNQIYENYQTSFDGDANDVIVVKNDSTKLNLGVKCFEILRQKGII